MSYRIGTRVAGVIGGWISGNDVTVAMEQVAFDVRPTAYAPVCRVDAPDRPYIVLCQDELFSRKNFSNHVMDSVVRMEAPIYP